MNRRIFWIGALVGAGALLLIEVATAAFGAINMSAAQGAGVLDEFGDLAWESSLMWRSPKTANPYADDPNALSVGLEHFRGSCVQCHGAPQVERASWAEGMLPLPPDLTQGETPERSDGELFRIISDGVRMTGMPAFGKEHTKKEIWEIVSFVRHLSGLTEQQRDSLREAVESHEHEHGHHEEAEAHQGTAAPTAAPGPTDEHHGDHDGGSDTHGG